MEAAGLAMGAVALASLFSLCVQCFDLVEVGQNTNSAFEIHVIKLSVEKRRLMIWGESVGILRPDQDRDPLLDEHATRELVERILTKVHRMFDAADNLRSKYGLECKPQRQHDSVKPVEGSSVCATTFDSSPLVQFQARFSLQQKKAGLGDKVRWAIRDSKKFTLLVQDLKELLDGLMEITTSPRSSILKGQLIREETESIPDLKMLRIIETTCSDPDWRESASNASTYFESQNKITPRKRDNIHDWMEVNERNGATTRNHSGFDHERHARNFRLKGSDGPYEGSDTEVLVLCSTSALKAWIPKTDKYFHAVYEIPQITTANAITVSRMMKAVRIPPHFQHPCITIYCPPRMRFVHMALSILNPNKPHSIRFNIRFDDRLLDKTTSFEGVAERMRGYYRDLEDCLYIADEAQRRIIDAIDINWLEQRIEVLENPAYRSVLNKLEWSHIFRQSRDDKNCAVIIVMAGEDTCLDMFDGPPVAAPDTFRDGRIYRLRELDEDGQDFRWQAEHFCNVSTDREFERLFGLIYE